MNNKVSIIIVSFNSEDFIQKCIDSILKHENDSEIIVIDNASTDNTLEKLKKYSNRIKIIESNLNLGFGKANNLAAKEATREYLLLLNPDAELINPVIEELVNFYENTPNIGLVGPKLVMKNGETQASVVNLPSLWRAVQEFIFGIKNKYFPYVPNSTEPIEVECVFGAALLIKKDLYKTVGGFDEKYFMYYEDIDLCKRIREVGKSIYYYPKVSIKHLVGATKAENKYQMNLKSSIIYHGWLKGQLFNLIFKLSRLLSYR